MADPKPEKTRATLAVGPELAIVRLKVKRDSEAYDPERQGACMVEFLAERCVFNEASYPGVPGVLVRLKKNANARTDGHPTFIPWGSVASVWPE